MAWDHKPGISATCCNRVLDADIRTDLWSVIGANRKTSFFVNEFVTGAKCQNPLKNVCLHYTVNSNIL